MKQWLILVRLSTRSFCRRANTMVTPDFAGNQYNVREGIQRRRDNNIEKDNGLSRGWTTLSATLPSVALDTDAELAYVFLPGAIKQRGKVCLSFSRVFCVLT